MGRHTIRQHVDAPPEVVFDLYTNLDRMPEWVGGVTSVSDVSGPLDQVGTRYIVWFGGRTASPTEIFDVERPHRFVTQFGNWLLRGRNDATFQPEGGGTRMTITLDTEGALPELMARIFSLGSWRGSFKGELRDFARLAEAEGRRGSME